MAEIIVIGSTNTDLVVNLPRLPKPGETILGGTFQVFAGGKGANQAVAAARMGADVHFVGAVGNDDFSRARLADLNAENIDTSLVKILDDAPGGTALIMIGQDAENMIAVAPGANAKLTPADADRAFDEFPKAQIVLMSLEIPLDVVSYAADCMVRECRTLILNPAPCPPEGLPDNILQHALLTPNQTEFETLGGPSLMDPNDPHVLKRALEFISDQHWDGAVVTLGANGAVLLRPGVEPVHVPSPRVKPVDTVGAGDCLNGTLAAELARDARLEDAVRTAVRAASIAVTRPGAQSGMPRREELQTE